MPSALYNPRTLAETDMAIGWRWCQDPVSAVDQQATTTCTADYLPDRPTRPQLPETGLVPLRRLVLPAGQLARQHRGRPGLHGQRRLCRVDPQCRERDAAPQLRAGRVRTESLVCWDSGTAWRRTGEEVLCADVCAAGGRGS